jgi:peptidoglycan/LPS O-acetylase OafA/YrhL
MDLSRIINAYSLRENVRSIFVRPAERYAAVDGLRALSMLWVILTHVSLSISRGMSYDAYVAVLDRAPWIPWILHGEKALDSFFVISGFLIGLMLLTEHKKRGKIDLGRFYARRYLRLMPAYGASLAILWSLHVQGPEKDAHVWANILYVNNFLPQRLMFMDWSWSLAVEEQFYLFLPVLLLVFFFRGKHKLAMLIGMGGLALLICAGVLLMHPNIAAVGFGEHFIVCAPHYSEEYFDAMYDNLATRFFPFVVGVGLAWMTVHHEEHVRRWFDARPRRRDALLAAGFASCVAVLAVPAFDPHVVLPHAARWLFAWGARAVWSLAVGLGIVATTFSGAGATRVVASFLSHRGWFPIAQLSYCGYLFHLAFVLPALWITFQVTGTKGVAFGDALAAVSTGQLVMTYLIVLLFTFLSGAGAYLTVERPFLNMRPR